MEMVRAIIARFALVRSPGAPPVALRESGPCALTVARSRPGRHYFLEEPLLPHIPCRRQRHLRAVSTATTHKAPDVRHELCAQVSRLQHQ